MFVSIYFYICWNKRQIYAILTKETHILKNRLTIERMYHGNTKICNPRITDEKRHDRLRTDQRVQLSIVRILECQPQSDLSEIKSPDQRRSDRISYRNNRNRTGKKVYTITDAGKEAFKKWEETLYPMPSLPKDEFRLQLFFSHLASPEFRIQLLQDQLSQHLDRLDYLKEDMEKFTVLPPVDDELFTDYLVLSGGIAREEAMCDWLKNCIRLCKSRSTL